MPVYDCGAPDCGSCQRAFGPDRSAAVKRFKYRIRASAVLRSWYEECESSGDDSDVVFIRVVGAALGAETELLS